MAGGLLSACAVLVGGVFALLVLLAPLANSHSGSHGFSPWSLLPFLATTGGLLLFAVLMFWTGRAMYRFQRWSRLGGVGLALVMLAVVAAALMLVLSSDHSLENLGQTSEPNGLFSFGNGGFLFVVLLVPFEILLEFSPFIMLLVGGCLLAWPLSISLLLLSKSGREVFAVPLRDTAPSAKAIELE